MAYRTKQCSLCGCEVVLDINGVITRHTAAPLYKEICAIGKGNDNPPKDYVESESKANQSPHPYRFQDINLPLMRRLSAAMQEGWSKYEQDLPPHEKNYLKADVRFALGRISNAIHHLLQLNDLYLSFLRGVPTLAESEDHLGHCAANLNMLAEWERTGLLPDSLPTQIPDVTHSQLENALKQMGAQPFGLGLVSDAEESWWQARGDSQADIDKRIAARGKAK